MIEWAPEESTLDLETCWHLRKYLLEMGLRPHWVNLYLCVLRRVVRAVATQPVRVILITFQL